MCLLCPIPANLRLYCWPSLTSSSPWKSFSKIPLLLFSAPDAVSTLRCVVFLSQTSQLWYCYRNRREESKVICIMQWRLAGTIHAIQHGACMQVKCALLAHICFSNYCVVSVSSSGREFCDCEDDDKKLGGRWFPVLSLRSEGISKWQAGRQAKSSESRKPSGRSQVKRLTVMSTGQKQKLVQLLSCDHSRMDPAKAQNFPGLLYVESGLIANHTFRQPAFYFVECTPLQ